MIEQSQSAKDALPVVLVTGVSGAGKSTALKCLEDLRYDAIDNVPLSLIERLLVGNVGNVPTAIGIDIRTRDFDAKSFLKQVETLATRADLVVRLLFIDCDDDILVRRFEETRRRHPLASDRPVSDGIREERAHMAFLRDGAEVVIDTSDMKPVDLKPLLEGHFGTDAQTGLNVFVMSFGFKYGLPRDADLVFDVRFLRNPYYEEALHRQTGLDPAVTEFIRRDDGFDDFLTNLKALLSPLFPRYAAEGKSYLTIAVGCTGGRHRSVCVTEDLSAWVAQQGEQVHVRHRDLENRSK